MKIFKFLFISCLFVAIVGLFSCGKSDPLLTDLESSLVGRWEAKYFFPNDTDTVSYDNNGSCAYALVGFEYSSGFELLSDGKSDLIWCGTNKGQIFDWSADEMTLIINENSFKLRDLTEFGMGFESVSEGHQYYLQKY